MGGGREGQWELREVKGGKIILGMHCEIEESILIKMQILRIFL